MDVSGYESKVEREILKVHKTVGEKNADKILEFLNDLEFDKISSGRRYAYILRLRKIESLMPDKFLNPSQEDIKQVILTIQRTKVKWGSGEEHFPSDNQQESYKVALKRFYRWLLGNNEEYPQCVKFIKIGNSHPSQQKKPEDLITEEEINKIVENALNQRDKAMFSLLYDSGCRIGELLTLKIKDVRFDDHGAMILVSGKTGVRQVRIVGDSVPYLRSWIEVHPDGNNRDATLFCGISGDTRNRPMNHPDVYSVLRKTLKRAGITRRIHPHLFRHTRGTILASKAIGNAPLESQMGWVHGSKQTATYVHLSGKEQDNAVLKAYGVKVEDESEVERRPIKCPRCDTLNPSTARRCKKCWLLLDVKEMLSEIEQDEKVAVWANTSLNVELMRILFKEAMKDPELKADFEELLERNK